MGSERQPMIVLLPPRDARARAALARQQSQALRIRSRKLRTETEDRRKVVAPRLSAREWSVLVLLSNALSTKEIAVQLGITGNTVNYHIVNVYRKLGVHSRVEAANLYRTRLKSAAG